MATKKKAPASKPLASDPEYMRQYRLQNNPDVFSRVAIKVKNYLTPEQAAKIEATVDKMIGKS